MNEFVEQEQLRGSVYHLLSRCYQLPDDSMEQVVKQLQMCLSEHHPNASAQVADMLASLEEDRATNTRLRDYLALFVGPKTLLAPPYGSLYLENKGQIMGESTREAMAYYKAAGLAKSPHKKEPDDHISIQLEFVGYLISRVMESTEDGEMERAQKFARLQLEFLDRHLSRWVPLFTRQMERQAATPFYRNLSLATESFVTEDSRTDCRQMMMELEELATEKNV